ncbi:MAG: response regulator [Rubripirellula sp.]
MSEKTRVLVVDDDEAIRHGTQLRLSVNGYEVDSAVDGCHAIEQVARFKPDVIVMDVRMPKMDGLTALAHLKSRDETASIPVIIASASPGDQNTSLDTGARYFLCKPFASASLLAAIESVC